MCAPLVVDQRMNLIDDEGIRRLQQMPAALCRQQDKQGLGSRDKNMRRPLDHLLPLGHRRISGSDGNADGRHQQTFFPSEFRDLVKRTFQILLDVVAQCLQRRNVHDLGFVLKRTVQSRSYEPVKTGQKGRQRFARSSRCRDQNIAAGDDLVPGQILSFGGTRKRMLKPFLNDGMKLHEEILKSDKSPF